MRRCHLSPRPTRTLRRTGRAVALVCAAVLCVSAALGDQTDQQHVELLDKLKREYSGDSQGLFRSLIEAVEGKKSDASSAHAEAKEDENIRKKLDDLQKTLTDPKVVAGRDQELTSEVLHIQYLTQELMRGVSDQSSSSQLTAITTEGAKALRELKELSSRLQKDCSRLLEAIDEYTLLSKTLDRKQSELSTFLREYNVDFDVRVRRTRLQNVLYIVFILELLLLATYATARKLRGSTKFDKLG